MNDTVVEVGRDGTVRIGSVKHGVQSELEKVSSDAPGYAKLRETIDELGICALDGDYVQMISHASTVVLDVPCSAGSKRFVLRCGNLQRRSPDRPAWPEVPWDEMRKLQRVANEVIALSERPPLLPR